MGLRAEDIEMFQAIVNAVRCGHLRLVESTDSTGAYCALLMMTVPTTGPDGQEDMYPLAEILREDRFTQLNEPTETCEIASYDVEDSNLSEQASGDGVHELYEAAKKLGAIDLKKEGSK